MGTGCFGLAHGCHGFSRIFFATDATDYKDFHNFFSPQITQMLRIFTDFFCHRLQRLHWFSICVYP